MTAAIREILGTGLARKSRCCDWLDWMVSFFHRYADQHVLIVSLGFDWDVILVDWMLRDVSL